MTSHSCSAISILFSSKSRWIGIHCAIFQHFPRLVVRRNVIGRNYLNLFRRWIAWNCLFLVPAYCRLHHYVCNKIILVCMKMARCERQYCNTDCLQHRFYCLSKLCYVHLYQDGTYHFSYQRQIFLQGTYCRMSVGCAAASYILIVHRVGCGTECDDSIG